MKYRRKRNCSAWKPATPKGADRRGNLRERSSVVGEIEKVLALEEAPVRIAL
jgi:hypothetical protein